MAHGFFLRRSLLPLFLFAFLLIRLNALFYPESSGWTVVDDELPTGNIAVDAGRGLLLPAPAYQFKPFAAGTMIEGLLSAPLRAVVGPNLLALKGAAIAIQLAALALWFLALWRLGGPIAAIVFGLLSVLPPPTWLHLTHTAWGNHAEQSLFTGALLYLLTAQWSKRNAGSGAAFGLGIIAGLATYFGYAGAPTILWLGAALVLLGATRRLPAAAAGTVVGLAPLAWSASFFGWSALGRIDTYTGYAAGEMVSVGRLFTETNFGDLPAKFARLVTHDLPQASLYPDAWTRWLFFAVAVASLVYVIVAAKRRVIDGEWRSGALWAIIPLYALVYAAVLVVSGFRLGEVSWPAPNQYMEYRYLAPLFPVAFAVIGLTWQALWDRAGYSLVPRLALLAGGVALALALCVPYYGSFTGGEFSSRVLQVRGDSYTHVVERLAMTVSRNQWSRTRKVAAAESLPPRFRRLFFEQLGKTGDQGLGLGLEMTKDFDAVVRHDLLRGYGQFRGALIAEQPPERWRRAVDDALVRNNLAEAGRRPAFLHGVGIGLARQSKQRPDRLVGMFEPWASLRADDYAALALGIGQFAGATLSYDLYSLTGMPDAFWLGHGRQVRRNVENMLLSNAPVASILLPSDRRLRALVINGYLAAGMLFGEAP